MQNKTYLLDVGTILGRCHSLEHFKLTRTTNVVRNAGYARSRYTLKFFLKSINELMN